MLDMLFSDMFDFTRDDLENNRRGILTQRQRARIWQRTRRTRLIYFVVGGGLMLVCILIVIAILGEIGNPLVPAFFIIIVLLLGLLSAAATVTILVGKQREYGIVKDRLAGAEVRHHCGPLSLSETGGQSTSYRLHAGSMHWQLSLWRYMKLKRRLNDARSYCIYWLPEAGYIVALEPASSAEPVSAAGLQ